jgi:PAS domain S-box-containing protein
VQPQQLPHYLFILDDEDSPAHEPDYDAHSAMEITRIADHVARGADPTDEQFRLLVSSVSDYAIYLLDPSGRVASWNAGAERIKGYRPDEIVGRHFSVFFPPEDRAAGRPEQLLGEALREGRVQAEGWRVRKDGARFWAEVVITALRDAGGTLKGFAKVTRDMTARHIEREREQLFAATFKHASHGIAVDDSSGRYIGANERFFELLGYTEAEILCRTVYDVTHPDDVAETRRVREELRGGATERLQFEKRFLRKDGRVIWAQVTLAPVPGDEPSARRFVAQVEDITERHAAEERLRESERRFRLLVEGVTDYAIYMLSPEGKISSWNAGAERIKGYTATEVLGRHFGMFFPAEDRATGKPEHALQIARNTGRFHDEGWRLRKDGSRFWALAVLDAIRDEKGELIGFAKITRDLSERRATEERLRQSEALLHAFTDNSPAMMSLKDRKGRYRFANARFLERHALHRDQVIGKDDAELFPRGQALAMSARDAEVMARGEPVQFEQSLRHGGIERASLVLKFPVADGIGAVATDITDRRLTEQALREQRALLAEAQKIAGVGSWEWDPESGRLLWSDELYRIHGVSRESFQPSFESYLERVHPEDRQQSGALMARALMDGRGFTMHERIVRPGGELRYLRSHGEVVRGERGRPIKILGACLDVTEQRHSESALRQAAQDLHALTRRLVQAEEAERRRIAGELHDRVGQSLSALNINLDIVLRELQGAPGLRRRLEDSAELVGRTLESIENVMAELRPPLLDEYGLAAALGWHADEFARRTGLEVIVQDAAPGAAKKLGLEAALALYRIAQEALNNVVKHARAKTVHIDISARDEELVLVVSDDGRGFDAAAAPRGRWGMTTMRERADAVGGRLVVESTPDAGTRVVVEVPF